MLFSDARNRPVMTTDTAETVGMVSGFIVDPALAKVIALRLRKSGGSGDTLHWDDLTAFGPDAVTVPSVAAIVDPRGRAAELDAKRSELVGKRVLTDAGDDIGTVSDVDFEPGSGSVIALVTQAGPVHGSRLIGCGSYAVIVRYTSERYV